MNTPEAIRELIARVEKCRTVAGRLSAEYEVFLHGDFLVLGRKSTSAIVVAEYMVDYYTCLETCFLRISQHFENHLSQDRWHADLLEKMTLRIQGVREAVVSEQSAVDLGELMKFRHFRRYYFELAYDWDKIAYLQKVFDRVRAAMPGELEQFQLFLGRLLEELMRE